MGTGWASAVVSLSGAAVAVVSVVVTLVEGRRARRNTDLSGHRDTWWQRWSWVVERALSPDERQRDAAALMAHAVLTRAWVTADDHWVQDALVEYAARATEDESDDEEGPDDDLA
jgi:hypothetical protein